MDCYNTDDMMSMQNATFDSLPTRKRIDIGVMGNSARNRFYKWSVFAQDKKQHTFRDFQLRMSKSDSRLVYAKRKSSPHKSTYSRKRQSASQPVLAIISFSDSSPGYKHVRVTKRQKKQHLKSSWGLNLDKRISNSCQI
eukprot:59558_1